MILEYSCAMQRRNIRRRRERNVFKYAIAIATVFHIYIEILHAAPASYDSLLPQSSDISEYFSDISGCYYNFQRYEEGDRIVTNEPCLNCTCHNRMLMCYLRVCPFTKAIGQDCTIEKKPDQCCPIITCPEVPVKLLTSSTTSSPTPTTQTTEVGFHDNYGCSIHDAFYADGAQVPADSKKPCELCYCIRNRTACVMQECTLQVEGCKPVYQEGVCCPVRYDCDYEREMTSTLRLQTSGGFTKSTTYASVVDCHYDNQTYADGELITTDKPCEHCYCMRGDIVCAVQECGEPLRGKDCVPTAPPPEKCCPSSYECPTDTQSTESIIKGTDFSNTDFPNRISTFEKLTTLEAVTTVKYDRPSTVLSQEEIYHRLGESTSKASTQVTSTEAAKESPSTVSEIPLSDNQPEDVQHDFNAIDDDDVHHTTLSSKPHKDESQLSHDGTTEDIQQSSVYNTVKPAFIPDQQTTLTPHVDSYSQHESNHTTIEAHQSEFTPSEESTHGLTNTPDQHSVSPSTDFSTTETFIKSSPTTVTDSNEVVEKVTDLSHKNPTTLIDISESVTTTSEAATKTPLQSASTDDLHQPLDVVSNDQTQEYQTETNQYSSVTKDYTKEKITTIREEIASNKISTTDVTQKISGLEDEQTTESLNTISNKNTESVAQDDSILNSKGPQPETQRPKISVETTTIDSVLLQNGETKPQSPIDTTSATLEGEEKETTTATAGIPGEGSCLVDGITYANSSIIESSNPCHSKCVCLSSIPTCTLVKCSPPPNDPKCMPIQIKPESCCPAYVCGGNDPLPPAHSIPSDSHVVVSQPPSDKYTTEEVISTTIIPIRSSTSSSTFNDIIDQNNIDAQEKQTAVPSNDITASELSTDKPITSSAVPLSSQVTSSDSGPLLDETNNEVSNDEQGIRLPDQNHSHVTVKEQSGLSTLVPQETSTAVNKDASDDVTSYVHEQPSSSSTVSNEIEITTQQEDDSTLPESNIIPEQHDQTLSTVLPAVSPNKAVDDAQEISTTNSAISENNYTGQEGQGEVVTITSAPASSTIKHSAADSTLDTQSVTTIKTDSNAVSDNSEEESEAGTTPSPVSNELAEENLIVSHHSSVTAGNSETTEGAYQTDENAVDVTTIAANESDNVDTKSSSLASSTTEQQKQPATATEFTTIKNTNDNNEISGVASTESTSESVDETTLSPEQTHTTILPDNDLSQKIPSSSPTIVTFESVKFTTDRTTSSQTESYESTVASSEPAQSYETTQIIESSSIVAEAESKPENEATTVLSETSSSTSLSSNDITFDSNNITNKIGNIPTEYSPIETSSASDSNLYEMETTTEIESMGANEKDDRTTITPFIASFTSSHSPHSTESIDSHTSANETGFEADSSSTTTIQQEESKSNTTADQTQPVSLTTVSVTAEPEPPTTPADTRPLSSTEKHASAIPVDSSSATPETTSFTSSFEPIQHSTWTRKPTQETITSTSEANYSPQPSMYPQGIDHSSSGAEAGTSMEEYDEDNGAFGPGTCRYAGKVYVSAQQIPRDDPCDFCFCFRSDIICLQQSCPPPIYGCRQEPILGFCCPRYECPVASYPSQNSTVTTTSTTTSTTLAPSRPPRYPAESYRSSVRRTGCLIHGYFYSVGDEISIASGPCLECTCGSDGRMKCDPKSCSPEPYVQQMMAESTYRKR